MTFRTITATVAVAGITSVACIPAALAKPTTRHARAASNDDPQGFIACLEAHGVQSLQIGGAATDPKRWIAANAANAGAAIEACSPADPGANGSTPVTGNRPTQSGDRHPTPGGPAKTPTG